MQLLMRVRALPLLCSSVEVMDFTQDHRVTVPEVFYGIKFYL